MKILIFSDIHANAYSRFGGKSSTGRNNRSQAVLNALDEIVNVGNDVDGVIFLGDLFHSRQVIDIDIASQVYNRLSKLITQKRMVIGNHDRGKFGSTSLDVLKALNDDIINDWKEMDSMVFASWGNLIPCLEKVKNRENKILFAHTCVSEAEVTPNVKIEGEVSVKDLQGFKKVFLGHYHKRQEVAPNIWYVGSLVQNNFGECGNDTGYCIYDTETDEVEFYNIDSPKFYIISYTEEFYADVEKGDSYLRVETSDSKNFERIHNSVELLRHDGYSILDYKIKLIVRDEENPLENISLDSYNFENMVDKYVDESVTDLDEDRLKKIGKRMINE